MLRASDVVLLHKITIVIRPWEEGVLYPCLICEQRKAEIG